MVVNVPLPSGWASTVYGTAVTSLQADTNGNLRVNAPASAPSRVNLALPTVGAEGANIPRTTPTLFPMWSDWDMRTALVTGGGIFTNTIGSAGSRQFIIEWRGEAYFDSGTAVNAQFAVVLFENSDNIRYIYALTGVDLEAGGLGSTVGVQAASTGTQFTQFSHDTASLSPGLQLDGVRAPGICAPGSGVCAPPVGVPVSGRVLNSNGQGVRNATVVITDSQGNRRTATTTSFGFYAFENVQAGGTYVFGVMSRRYRFASRVVNVTGPLTDVNFVGAE